MAIRNFPPVDFADENGLLAIGGDLEPHSLILAYKNGIFPWPHENYPLLWFAPPQRAVIFLEEAHISRSLRKESKRTKLTFSQNKAFREVMQNCSELTNRPGQRGTWITPQIIDAYEELFHRNHAYSVEAWNGKELVGGFYGVHVGKYYGGESMFYREPNASKLAFIYFMDQLKHKGIPWLDCQTLTHTFEGFGAREIPRAEFMNLLGIALKERE